MARVRRPHTSEDGCGVAGLCPPPSSGRRLKPLGGVGVGKEDRILLGDTTGWNSRIHSQKTCHHRDFSSARRQPKNPA